MVLQEVEHILTLRDGDGADSSVAGHADVQAPCHVADVSDGEVVGDASDGVAEERAITVADEDVEQSDDAGVLADEDAGVHAGLGKRGAGVQLCHQLRMPNVRRLPQAELARAQANDKYGAIGTLRAALRRKRRAPGQSTMQGGLTLTLSRAA